MQKNENNKEQAIYYLSQTLVGYEIKYVYLKKLCLAVVFETKKLRYYMLNHTTYVIAKANLIKYIMNKIHQNVRTSKWIMHLIEFNLIFIILKSIKGWVIANYLAEILLPNDDLLIIELPDEHVFQLNE